MKKIKSDNIQQLQCSLRDLHCEIIFKLRGHILEKYIICRILQVLKLYCLGILVFNYTTPISCVAHLIVTHPFFLWRILGKANQGCMVGDSDREISRLLSLSPLKFFPSVCQRYYFHCLPYFLFHLRDLSDCVILTVNEDSV